MEVNGKTYPLWGQFVEKKAQWIGGTLQDHECEESTIITDIRLEPNGKDSAMFTIKGEAYSCAFDVRYGGVGGCPVLEEGIAFSTQFGINFTIAPK